MSYIGSGVSAIWVNNNIFPQSRGIWTLHVHGAVVDPSDTRN